VPPQATGRLIIALVDATGSFGHFRESLRRLARFAVEELDMGDAFAVGLIKDKLRDDDFLVPFTTLPMPERRIGDAAEIEALAAKKQMRDTLLAYADATQVKKVEGTDLNQAVAYAGRLLQGDPREMWLLLFTDFEDTENRPAPWCLAGVHVRGFFVPTRGDLVQAEHRESARSDRFARTGTASSAVYLPAQARSLSRLLLPATPSEPPPPESVNKRSLADHDR
jgi:hypothetical protein